MPGIIKEVDGKYYVDGGPACRKCDGDGKSTLAPEDEHGRDVPASRLLCPVCHGTGVQAAQDWPDKVKAEWLKTWLLHYLRINPICPTGDTCEWEWEISNMKTRKSLAKNKDFSVALTEAVIEIARQEVTE